MKINYVIYVGWRNMSTTNKLRLLNLSHDVQKNIYIDI